MTSVSTRDRISSPWIAGRRRSSSDSPAPTWNPDHASESIRPTGPSSMEDTASTAVWIECPALVATSSRSAVKGSERINSPVVGRGRRPAPRIRDDRCRSGRMLLAVPTYRSVPSRPVMRRVPRAGRPDVSSARSAMRHGQFHLNPVRRSTTMAPATAGRTVVIAATNGPVGPSAQLRVRPARRRSSTGANQWVIR